MEGWELSTPLHNLKQTLQIQQQLSDASAKLNREIQRAMNRPPEQIVDARIANFQKYLNDPDNIGGRAAYEIYKNMHDSKESYREGDWVMGTVHALNAGINTTTLVGAGEFLATKKGIQVKTEPWHSTTDGNYVGSLANRLGKVVLDIDVNYKFSGGEGDVDIVTSAFNVEVKSGNKMKLTQSLKNMDYAKSQGKGYLLYMPSATASQTKEAKKQGISIIKNEAELKKALGSK